MYRVAVVEDDARLRSSIVRGLRAEELEVPLETGTGREFLSRVESADPDVVVLDIGLPDCDGRDLCLALRARGFDTPVLFLTALAGTGDLLLGFHAGADDYLPKPFAFAEFLVRVSALGRRHVRERPPDPALALDPVGHCIRGSRRSVPVTPTEFRLLSTLLARRGQVVRRRALVAAAWPDGSIVHDNTLDSYLLRVRRKLAESDPDLGIDTVRGVGYRLQ